MAAAEPHDTSGDTVYRYTNLEDETVFEVVRRPGKKFLQRRPDPAKPGQYIWNLDDIDRVPYRWLQLDMTADEGGTIFVVEGEKDADRLATSGLTATTSAGGAAWEWPDSWAEHFRGAGEVIVLADNDLAGRKAALQRAQVVARTVSDVKVLLEWPSDVPEKGDVSDYLNRHTAEDLWKLGGTAPPVEQAAEDLAAEKRTLEVRWATDAMLKPPDEPEVLIEGLLRRGELAVFGSLRGVGKSWAAMNLAYLLAEGEGFFFGALAVRRQARVLIAQGEIDEWGTYARWRMMSGDNHPPAGVAETFDRWRIRIVKRRTSGKADGMDAWSDEWYDAVLDGRIEETIRRHRFDVLIIDPWAVYFAGNENNNDEVEAALDKLRDLAMRYGTAIVIFHHTGKASPDNREPEDLWRGASRLADWASTRVTMLPHFTEKRAKDQNMTRRQARRYLDVFFLRRSAPTDDFSIVLNLETGWWEKWNDPKEAGRAAAEAQRIAMDPYDVQQLCYLDGGEWPSIRVASESMKVSQATAKKLLKQAVMHRALEEYLTPRNGTGYRLPHPKLTDDLMFADNPGLSKDELAARREEKEKGS